MLESQVAEWVPAARRRRIDIGFERAHVPLHVDGNPVLLTEMFKNLIDNAIKYTPVGGVVTVRLRADIRAIFEVEDSGSGIAVEDRQRVFERFYRALGTQAEGSGLGLPIVREIAELHRADVELLHAQRPVGPAGPRVLPARDGQCRRAGIGPGVRLDVHHGRHGRLGMPADIATLELALRAVVVLKGLNELLLLTLIAQGVLALLAGRQRHDNLIYNTFNLVGARVFAVCSAASRPPSCSTGTSRRSPPSGCCCSNCCSSSRRYGSCSNSPPIAALK
jgi:hypothetical protein